MLLADKSSSSSVTRETSGRTSTSWLQERFNIRRDVQRGTAPSSDRPRYAKSYLTNGETMAVRKPWSDKSRKATASRSNSPVLRFNSSSFTVLTHNHTYYSPNILSHTCYSAGWLRSRLCHLACVYERAGIRTCFVRMRRECPFSNLITLRPTP